MLKDKCQTTIDEALTVANKSQLSAGAIAHIESCLACRRSLEAITALSASVESILPLENNIALKQKIFARLEPAIRNRNTKACHVSSNATKVTPTKNLVSALIVLGTGAALFLAAMVYYLDSSTNNKAAEKQNSGLYLSESKSSSISEPTTPEKKIKGKIVGIDEADKEIFQDGYDGDLRDLEPRKVATQEIPSPIKD